MSQKACGPGPRGVRLRRLLACAFVACATLQTIPATAQIFRASFDDSLEADVAAGRRQPWDSRGVQLVPGKFGRAAHIESGQLSYGGEHNVLAGAGTITVWCRIPQRPGPLDIQRLVFVQSKERGHLTCLATLEWQESAFRAMVFDFAHGHGWHDPAAFPGLTESQWHHLALVWDQAAGVQFFLDGKLAGSTWGKQAWWDRPTPHGIHLSYPGADYDELGIYDRPLSAEEVGSIAADNNVLLPIKVSVPDDAARRRLIDSLGAVTPDCLPAVAAATANSTTTTTIRQTVPRNVRDDRIPAWKVVDGRMNLFWPEWRAPTFGDVDFSGSELTLQLQPDDQPTHLLLRGLISGCRVFGLRDGYTSLEPVAAVPSGRHQLAAFKCPAGLTGVRVPRRETMRLHEIGLFNVQTDRQFTSKSITTSLMGPIEPVSLGAIADWIATRTKPGERTVLSRTAQGSSEPVTVAGTTRIHFATDPVDAATPLDAVRLRLNFAAPWQEDIWWLRVQDPVNPRRDLMHIPVRITNPAPGSPASVDVTLDHWDLVLDPGTRLWIELLPQQTVSLISRDGQFGQLALVMGDREKVLAEFAETQSQLAFSYWQLGSEADGTGGSDPERRTFNLLGGITDNYELKLTLEWIRRHVTDNPLANDLWRITFGRSEAKPKPVTPRLQPEGAPDWAVWGRELLERYRSMSHHWAEWQGPDGQIGGGWNDDTDFPGVFLCLPLLGDTTTGHMFERIYDGLEATGYLHHGVSRAPIDTRHAADFLSWRAHLMLFDYGAPRHVERALKLTKELHRWTKLDERGHRRGITAHYSEFGPERRPNSKINDDGSIEQLTARDDYSITPLSMDPFFCAWYSQNPAVMQYVREVAAGEYARAQTEERLSTYSTYPFLAFHAIFSDPKYIDAPIDRSLFMPMWRRTATDLTDATRFDEQLLKGADSQNASDGSLAAGYLVNGNKAYLVRGLKQACEELAGGWQFRGGAARGANDHFNVPGQAVLSQMYLGCGLTWLRSATTAIPPIVCSWEGIEDNVAAIVFDASPTTLRVACYNFDEQPRDVRMRVWRLDRGTYGLRTGPDANGNDQIDDAAPTDRILLQRSMPVPLRLPARQVFIVELRQLEPQPRPRELADLAIGSGDVAYDKATDLLKVVVHNIGARPAENVSIRFLAPDGRLLGESKIARLDAPIDLEPQMIVVGLPQPLIHPLDGIDVVIDPDDQIGEITDENNGIRWRP